MKYPAPGYEGYGWRRGPEYLDCYDYHVFVSYTRVDLDIAAAVAARLVGENLTVFFAPESVEPLVDEESAFWSEHMESALLASCHFIGILTDTYLTKPWAGGLELHGFWNIHRSNPERRMLLLGSGDHPPVMVPGMPECTILGDTAQAMSWALRAVHESHLALGTPYDPPQCFAPLPLRDIPRMGGGPWGDDSHRDLDPPYSSYEACVRELMVLITCGADPARFPARFAGRSRWQAHHIEDATSDARYLVEHGVLPY